MDISRFSIVESEVRPLIVVQPDGLLNSSLSMLPIEEKGIEPILDFEDAIDAFGQGILIAVADLAHARADAGGEEPLTIGSRGVLDAVVRMMNHAGQRGCGRLVQGHVKGAKTAFDGERGGQIIANNEAREGIGEEGQIGETGLSREVGDVADPHLVNAMETEFSDQVGNFQSPGRVVRRWLRLVGAKRSCRFKRSKKASRPLEMPSSASWGCNSCNSLRPPMCGCL